MLQISRLQPAEHLKCGWMVNKPHLLLFIQIYTIHAKNKSAKIKGSKIDKP